jgi:hypothetical protein|tara:strand:+ start:2621 stop:2917 length:297 start_codon:yes stop_codon:yes gene_type:complete
MKRPVSTNETNPSVVNIWGKFDGTLSFPKNQRVLRPSSISGSIHIIGINNIIPNKLTIEKSSDILEIDLGQCALAILVDIATIGAPPAAANIKANKAT